MSKMCLVTSRAQVCGPELIVPYRTAVLWIRIGFKSDPGPALDLNADPDPGRTLPPQKVELLH
jgi:hypothetical protein